MAVVSWPDRASWVEPGVLTIVQSGHSLLRALGDQGQPGIGNKGNLEATKGDFFAKETDY